MRTRVSRRATSRDRRARRCVSRDRTPLRPDHHAVVQREVDLHAGVALQYSVIARPMWWAPKATDVFTRNVRAAPRPASPQWPPPPRPWRVSACTLVIVAARFGERELARGPVEQPHAQMRFELGHVARGMPRDRSSLSAAPAKLPASTPRRIRACPPRCRSP